jgi:hypothetical protein
MRKKIITGAVEHTVVSIRICGGDEARLIGMPMDDECLSMDVRKKKRMKMNRKI